MSMGLLSRASKQQEMNELDTHGKLGVFGRQKVGDTQGEGGQFECGGDAGKSGQEERMKVTKKVDSPFCRGNLGRHRFAQTGAGEEKLGKNKSGKPKKNVIIVFTVKNAPVQTVKFRCFIVWLYYNFTSVKRFRWQ